MTQETIFYSLLPSWCTFTVYSKLFTRNRLHFILLISFILTKMCNSLEKFLLILIIILKMSERAEKCLRHQIINVSLNHKRVTLFVLLFDKHIYLFICLLTVTVFTTEYYTIQLGSLKHWERTSHSNRNHVILFTLRSWQLNNIMFIKFLACRITADAAQ